MPNNFDISRLNEPFDVWMNKTNVVTVALDSLIREKAEDPEIPGSGTGTQYPHIDTQNLHVYGKLEVENVTRFNGDFTFNIGYVLDKLYFTNSEANKALTNPRIESSDSSKLDITSGDETGANYSRITLEKHASDDSQDKIKLDTDILNIESPTINLPSEDVEFVTTDKIEFNVGATENIIFEQMDGAHPEPLVQNEAAITLPNTGILRFGNVAIRSTGNSIEFNPDISNTSLTWDSIGGGSGSSAVDYKNVAQTGGVYLANGIDVTYLTTADVGTPVSVEYDNANNRLKYVGASADSVNPVTKMGVLTEQTIITGGNYNLSVTFLGIFTFDTNNSIFQAGHLGVNVGEDYFVSASEVGKITIDENAALSDFAFRVLEIDGTTATALIMPYRPAGSGAGHRLVQDKFTNSDGIITDFQLSYAVPSMSADYVMAFVNGALDEEISIVENAGVYSVSFATAPPAGEVVIRYFKDVPIGIIDAKLNRTQYKILDTHDVTVGASYDKGKYEIWVSDDPLISADVYFNGTDANTITVSGDVSGTQGNSSTLNIYVDGGNLKVQNNLGSDKIITVFQKL